MRASLHECCCRFHVRLCLSVFQESGLLTCFPPFDLGLTNELLACSLEIEPNTASQSMLSFKHKPGMGRCGRRLFCSVNHPFESHRNGGRGWMHMR